ncbi:MAG: N(5)-(carboxyethyl)ornithine synthase [Candidatus Nanopelagicales bacterium]
MSELSLGLIGRSSMENERRVPIHPRHLDQIDADLRARMVVERGYGERFGVLDEVLAALVGRVASREEVLATADVVLLPKPLRSDVESLRDGQVLWGWPHLVQDRAMTQLAIDKHLTFIAWEAMNHWMSDGSFGVHVFHMNNEIAGYCSVLHAMTLIGATGHYGRHLKAVVIGFGNTARGAVLALQSLGVHDVTVLTQREVAVVAAPIPSANLEHMERVEADPSRTSTLREQGSQPTAAFLAEHDIIVNCVFQDTDRPLMFVTGDDLAPFRPGSLIVDVSCDEGMGFDFARPTTFEQPMFDAGNGVHYYGVDHSPSLLFDSSSWVISEALIPHLRTVMAGPDAWVLDETIRQAIEIREGVIQNPKILSFQGRSATHPHPVDIERG